MRKKFKVLIGAAVLLGLIAVGCAPTYTYHDEPITTNEFLALYETGETLHCVQVPTAFSRTFMIADEFACFDTLAEADTYAETLP